MFGVDCLLVAYFVVCLVCWFVFDFALRKLVILIVRLLFNLICDLLFGWLFVDFVVCLWFLLAVDLLLACLFGLFSV